MRPVESWNQILMLLLCSSDGASEPESLRAGLRYWVADLLLYIRGFIGMRCYRICDCETNFLRCLDLFSVDF